MKKETIKWSDFGINPNSLVSIQDIEQVEKYLYITFPDLYKDLLLFAKEASPALGVFTYGDVYETSISDFFDCSTKNEPYSIVWYKLHGASFGLPKTFIPIARDAGGYLICFDYTSFPPKVKLYDPDQQLTYFIAENFEKFVELWHE